LDLLKGDFPSENETNRQAIIKNREIELSQFFIKKAFSMTCIEHPENEVNLTNYLPIKQDEKHMVKGDHSFFI